MTPSTRQVVTTWPIIQFDEREHQGTESMRQKDVQITAFIEKIVTENLQKLKEGNYWMAKASDYDNNINTAMAIAKKQKRNREDLTIFLDDMQSLYKHIRADLKKPADLQTSIKYLEDHISTVVQLVGSQQKLNRDMDNIINDFSALGKDASKREKEHRLWTIVNTIAGFLYIVVLVLPWFISLPVAVTITLMAWGILKPGNDWWTAANAGLFCFILLAVSIKLLSIDVLIAMTMPLAAVWPFTIRKHWNHWMKLSEVKISTDKMKKTEENVAEDIREIRSLSFLKQALSQLLKFAKKHPKDLEEMISFAQKVLIVTKEGDSKIDEVIRKCNQLFSIEI